MTNDELLAAALDGTLTSEQESLLHRRCEEDANFAKEYAELSTIEDDLRALGQQPSSEITSSFLSRIEDNMMTIIATGAAASVAGGAMAGSSGAAGGGAAATAAGAASSFLGLGPIGAALAAIGAAAVVGSALYFISPEPEAPQQPTATAEVPQQTQPKEPVENTTDPVPANTRQELPAEAEIPPVATPEPVTAPTPQTAPQQKKVASAAPAEGEAAPSAAIALKTDSPNDPVTTEIDNLQAKLRSSGDAAIRAQLNMRIGRLYAHKSEWDNARAAFVAAAQYAHSVGLGKLEIDALRDAAGAARRAGDTSAARRLLEQCAAVAETVDPATAEEIRQEIRQTDK